MSHAVNLWSLLSHAECVGVVFCITWQICPTLYYIVLVELLPFIYLSVRVAV